MKGKGKWDREGVGITKEEICESTLNKPLLPKTAEAFGFFFSLGCPTKLTQCRHSLLSNQQRRD